VTYFPANTITTDAALRDLQTGSPKARAAAAHALGDVVGDERARAAKALRAALDDTHAAVRAEAAASLGEIGGETEGIVELLAKRLSDGDPQVRQNAAISLGTLGQPAGFAPLVTALQEGPPDVRFQAASSLAEIDAVMAFDPLVAALDDRDPHVAGAIALALGAIGDARAIDPLVALLDRLNPEVKFDAAYALAELRDPRGRAVLATALDDAARAWDAATALEWLGGEDDARALASLLDKKKAEPHAVVRAAGAILRLARTVAVSNIDTSAAKRALLAALAQRKLPVRGLAVQELATAGDDDWARQPLERLRAGRKGRELAEEIAETLRQIGERS
jgi:HEAT repeat protein